MSERNLYRGMALPWGNSLASYFEPKGDRDVLRTSVQMILFTKIRERVMLPAFGSPLHEAVFEPGDEELEAALKQIVSQNVPFWDQRLRVLDVSVTSDHHVTTVSVVYEDLALANVTDRFSFTVPTQVVTRIS